MANATTLSQDLVDFIENNECWLHFYHNDTDWIKTDDLRSDFYKRLQDLINEGYRYILMIDFYTNLDGTQGQRWVKSTESLISKTKKEIEDRLEEELKSLEDEGLELNEEKYGVYDITQDKYCSVKNNKVWNWN